MNLGGSALVSYILIVHGLVVNSCHAKLRCAKYCTNMPPKALKRGQNLHLMTSSSVNIGQSDLLSTVQIDVYKRSNYHHRLLGRGLKFMDRLIDVKNSVSVGPPMYLSSCWSLTSKL